MRDHVVYQQMHATAQKVALIYKQVTFLDSRLQSFESVLQTSTWWERLFGINHLIQKVDRLHLALIQKHDEELKKHKQEQAAKPKLTIVSPTGAVNGQ